MTRATRQENIGRGQLALEEGLDHLCKSVEDLGLVFLSYHDLPHMEIEWGNTYDSLEKWC